MPLTDDSKPRGISTDGLNERNPCGPCPQTGLPDCTARAAATIAAKCVFFRRRPSECPIGIGGTVAALDLQPFPKAIAHERLRSTYSNGDVAVITAWTPEAALAIAEEDGELYGCPGMEAVAASLLDSHAAEA